MNQLRARVQVIGGALAVAGAVAAAVVAVRSGSPAPRPRIVGPSNTSPSAAPTAPTAPDPAASAFDRCPSPPPLPYGVNADQSAVAAARAAVPRVYTDIDAAGFRVTASGPATPAGAGHANAGYYILPYGMCGPTVGARTYVVELYFPAMAPQGADLSHGQLFLSRFPQGWQAWYRYH